MRGGQRIGDRHAAGALPRVPGRRPAARRRDALPALPRRGRREVGARPHGVLEAVRALRRIGAPARRRAVRRAAGQQVEMRSEPLTINMPPGWPTARASACRARATSAGTAARPATSTSRSTCEPHPLFRARRRRPPRDRADRGSRSGARREDRGAVARRPGAAARAAGHAVGPALPAARARRAVAARRPARRPRGRGPAGAAEAARRAIEGAAAGVRTDQRRRRTRG